MESRWSSCGGDAVVQAREWISRMVILRERKRKRTYKNQRTWSTFLADSAHHPIDGGADEKNLLVAATDPSVVFDRFMYDGHSDVQEDIFTYWMFENHHQRSP
jgi:hypothetical protein